MHMIPVDLPCDGNVLQLRVYALGNAADESKESSRIVVSYGRWFGIVPDLGLVSLADGKEFSPCTRDGSVDPSAMSDSAR